MNKTQYNLYLKSNRWRKKRKQIKTFWDNRCAICNSEKNIHVHHRTYERLGRELTTDLIALCAVCHGRHHDKLAGDSNE